MLINIGGNKKFLSTKNCKNNDVITILDEGVTGFSDKFKYPDGNPKKRYDFKVSLDNVEYVHSMNKYSRDNLAIAWGTDTAEWVGKRAIANIEHVRSLDTDMIVLSPIKPEQEQEGEWLD